MATRMWVGRVVQLQQRSLSTIVSTTKPSHHQDHVKNHVYLEPTTFVGSFVKDQPPQTPKEAAAKLARLRREYALQVKGIRKQFIEEVELQRLEKLRKDEARKAEVQRQKEERRKVKAAAALARAAQHKVSQDQFRLTLMKEREEKLEYWRKRHNAMEERKKNKKELICQESYQWIDEEMLEEKTIESVIDSQSL